MSGVTLDGSDGKIMITGADGTEADVVTGLDGVNRLQIEVTGGSGSGTDELVKVSDNDTTPGTLIDKLVAGTNITLVENNDGGNETITINGPGGGGGGVTSVNGDVGPAVVLDKSDIGLSNVDNTSDADKPVSTAQAAADTALQNQIDSNDTDISSLQSSQSVQDAAIALNTAKVSFPEAPNDGQQYGRQSLGWTVISGGAVPIFGSEAEDFLDTSNTNITTATLFAVRTFTTASKPTGRYRVAMQVQLEPGSASNDYLFQLRINGTQIGLEMQEEGKDVGSNQRNIRPLVGYFDHTGPATFDIELWAAREGSTLVLHGVSAEVWRVS